MSKQTNTAVADAIEEAVANLEEAAETEHEGTLANAPFIEFLRPVAEAMDNLDEFSQSRMVQDIGRGLMSAMGWNRAFKENVMYGSYATAIAIQGTERDENGVFLGFYGEDEIDPNTGKPFEDIYDSMSTAQTDLCDDLDDKEDLLWEAFDAAESAYKDLQGSDKVVFIKPSNKQRADGIKSIEDMIEAQKRYALEWNIKRDEESASKHKKLSAEARAARNEMRAQRKAKRTSTVL